MRVLIGLVVVGVMLSGCDALTIGTSGKLADNVGVSVGTTITDKGVQRPRGSVTVGLF